MITQAPKDCDQIMGMLMGATTVIDEPTYDASSSAFGSSPADGHLDTSSLGGATAWHPQTDAAGQYLQINFDKVVIARKVLIRGDASDDSYVTKVAIHSTRDGVEWSRVNEHSLEEDEQLVFVGNTDSTSVRQVRATFPK